MRLTAPVNVNAVCRFNEETAEETIRHGGRRRSDVSSDNFVNQSLKDTLAAVGRYQCRRRTIIEKESGEKMLCHDWRRSL